MRSVHRNDGLTIVLSYSAFIGLGLISGLLGLAWTPMRAEFELSLDAVGVLLLANMVGYLSASFLTGYLILRIGAGKYLILGSGMMALGLSLFVTAPVWEMVIVAGLVANIGVGFIDAGLNAYVAEHHSARAMNWLHACFGIGTTLSPLLMTAILNGGGSWRIGYAVVCVFMAILLGVFAVTRDIWRMSAVAGGAGRTISMPSTLGKPLVWLGILMFFLYAGLEATPGQWAFPMFTETRGVEAELAGLLVSLYWGSFTIGRIFFGAIINRVSTGALLSGCLTATVIGAALLWWNPLPAVGYVGLLVLGFAQAPLFPVLISLTPKIVGAQHAPNAIGFQVAGAGLGVAVLPGLAGVLAERISLDIVTPFVLVCTVLMLLMYQVGLARRARRVSQQPAVVQA